MHLILDYTIQSNQTKIFFFFLCFYLHARQSKQYLICFYSPLITEMNCDGEEMCWIEAVVDSVVEDVD